MSSEQLLTALLASAGTLLAALGAFLAKSRLSDVLVSPSSREETAVSKMAAMLDNQVVMADKLADFQNTRENRLFDLQEKALETVQTMTDAIKDVTIAVQTHDISMSRHVGDIGDAHGDILDSVGRVSGQLEMIGNLLSDLAIEVKKQRNELSTEG